MGNILIIAVVIYGSLAVHELGHFFAFLHNKIPMRMLSIGVVTFIFDGSRWRMVLNRNKAGVSGIAIPNLTVISNQREFEGMQKGYANAILGGPIASLLLVGAGGIMLIIGLTGQIGLNNLIVVTGLSLIAVNMIMVMSCFIKTDHIYGDFPAYDAYKNDVFFAALMMYQYTIFAVAYEETRKNNLYLRNILMAGLLPRVSNQQTDLLTVSCVSTFIGEYLIGLNHQIAKPLRQYIDFYHKNYHIIVRTNKTQAHQRLLLDMAYFFKKEGLEDSAINIYKNFIQKLPKTEVFDYWKIQSEQIIMEKDHSDYLLNKKNIKPNLTYGIFKKLDGFYHDELLLNQIMVPSKGD